MPLDPDAKLIGPLGSTGAGWTGPAPGSGLTRLSGVAVTRDGVREPRVGDAIGARG
jgi:hypothetical protein